MTVWHFLPWIVGRKPTISPKDLLEIGLRLSISTTLEAVCDSKWLFADPSLGLFSAFDSLVWLVNSELMISAECQIQMILIK